MKIERNFDGNYLIHEDGIRRVVHREIAQALFRSGAEWQRKRDATVADERAGGQAFKRGAAIRIAETIRAQPITTADIEAAIGEGE